MGLSRGTYVCVPCRRTARVPGHCPHCQAVMLDAGKRWRPPRRRNDKAWAKVAAGNWLTEPPRGNGQVPYRTAHRDPEPERPPRPERPSVLARQLLDALLAGADPATAAHPDLLVRLGITRAPELPAAALSALAGDSHSEIRRLVAKHPNLDLAGPDAARLARDADAAVRAALTTRPGLPHDLLRRALRDRDQAVVAAAAGNAAAPVHWLLHVPLGYVPQERLAEVLAFAAPALADDAIAVSVLQQMHGTSDVNAREAVRLVRTALTT